VVERNFGIRPVQVDRGDSDADLRQAASAAASAGVSAGPLRRRRPVRDRRLERADAPLRGDVRPAVAGRRGRILVPGDLARSATGGGLAVAKRRPSVR